MSKVDLLAPPDEAAIEKAIEMYTAVLRLRFGNRLKSIFLFGSRARGDFRPYSDVDLAIVLGETTESRSLTTPLSELAYDVFLETGVEIQPWSFPEAEWKNPERSASAALIRSAKRESRALALS